MQNVGRDRVHSFLFRTRLLNETTHRLNDHDVISTTSFRYEQFDYCCSLLMSHWTPCFISTGLEFRVKTYYFLLKYTYKFFERTSTYIDHLQRKVEMYNAVHIKISMVTKSSSVRTFINEWAFLHWSTCFTSTLPKHSVLSSANLQQMQLGSSTRGQLSPSNWGHTWLME